MKPLKIGITGVRGIVGETFTPEVAVGFAQAFATYLDSGRILVCRDTRLSGPMVRSAVVAGLLAGQTITELVSTLPRFAMIKEKLVCPSDKVSAVLRMLRHEYAAYPMDLRDGVKVSLPDAGGFW